ncbi:hypothetical protein C8J56DRAFT_923779, partial [Mycena floridula]
MTSSHQVLYTYRRNPDDFTFQHLFKTASVVEMMDLVRSRIPDSGLRIDPDLAVRMLDITTSNHFLLANGQHLLFSRFFLQRVATRSLSIIEFDFFAYSLPTFESEFEFWTSSDVAQLKDQLYQNKLPPHHPLSQLYQTYWNKPDMVPHVDSLALGSETYQVYNFDIQSLPYLEKTNGRMLVRPEYSHIQASLEELHLRHVSTQRGTTVVILVGQEDPCLQLLYGTLETIKKGQQALLYYHDVGYFFCQHGVFAASPEFLSNLGDCQQLVLPPFSAEMKIMSFIDQGVDPALPPPSQLTFEISPFFPILAVSPAHEEYHTGHRWFKSVSKVSYIQIPSWTAGELDIL